VVVIRSIPIPGDNRISSPNAQILGDKDTALTLTVSYHFFVVDDYDSTKRPKKRIGEISFTSLIGFRFCWAEMVYDEYPEIYDAMIAEIEKGHSYVLNEIMYSPYIEHMLSTNYHSHLDNRMGYDSVQEADVKHFQISIDKYGVFDVLALEVSTNEYEA